MVSRLWLGAVLLTALRTAAGYTEQAVLGPGKIQEQSLLLRFLVQTPEQLESFLDAAQTYNLDIWQITPDHIDVYSPPSLLPDTLSNQTYTSHILPETNSILHRGPSISRDEWNLTSLENSTFHGSYHPLFEIDEFMQEIGGLYPDLVSIKSLGHSGEGREMLGMTISKPPGNESLGMKKGAFVVTGAQHAREWVATATSLYLIHALVANVSEPQSLTHLLDRYDFHIVPVPNPDGYDYTWETDRFWYKNRMIISPTAQCLGLDMNRNWGYKWKSKVPALALEKKKKKKKPKKPMDPCSHWYPGSRPFEAPEVNNIANYLTSLADVKVFVDLRAYGQMLSSPYSYSCKRSPQAAEDQAEAAMGATFALRQVHGTEFSTGSLCSMLYRAPGNIVDWMYARAGVKYSYAAHLRDTGTYGFSLPAQWIRPVGEETGSMIAYLAKFILQNPND